MQRPKEAQTTFKNHEVIKKKQSTLVSCLELMTFQTTLLLVVSKSNIIKIYVLLFYLKSSYVKGSSVTSFIHSIGDNHSSSGNFLPSPTLETLADVECHGFISCHPKIVAHWNIRVFVTFAKDMCSNSKPFAIPLAGVSSGTHMAHTHT